MSVVTRPSPEVLRGVPTLADLPDEELSWLASRAEAMELGPNQVLFRQGEPPAFLFVLLAGAVRVVRQEGRQEVASFVMEAGEITGILPFSRMVTQGATGTALATLQVARLSQSCFEEMFVRAPQLMQRLVNLMVDRSREYTRMSEQREKLASLGKLSAGLAHELNNPAAAARRASAQLKEALKTSQARALRLTLLDLDADKVGCLVALPGDLLRLEPPRLSALALSDREDELGDWLDDHNVTDGWQHTATLAQAGVTTELLEHTHAQLGEQALAQVVPWLEATLTAYGLVKEVHDSSARISELVGAVKSYTHMDRAPLQEIDLHEGLETTLTMLSHKLRSITVQRAYGELPRICAYGSELNQVWTNLVVNAAEAMQGEGTLTLRTSVHGDTVTVEVIDDGPGIPGEVKVHIFEPFFTTKGVGEGTGLGLDISYRIVVKRHHGTLQVESEPGRTCFQVRLPVALRG